MTELTTLEYGLTSCTGVVAALDDSQMETVSNCAPWTVRQLASHAVNNQLLWAGLVTGNTSCPRRTRWAASPTTATSPRTPTTWRNRALAMWRTDGVLEAIHVTPLGELPGSVVISFAIIDAVAHAWDLSASVGRAIEFTPEELPTISAIVDAVCNDDAAIMGLIQPPTELPGDATETERLMAAAGRAISR